MNSLKRKHISKLCMVVYCLNILPYPCLQMFVYTISAQVVKLTTLPIEFGIKLPTKWYMAALVPRGCNETYFLGYHLTDYCFGKK